MKGSVNLRGSGYYELDVTDYVSENAGGDVAFLLSPQKAAGETEIYTSDFSVSLGKCTEKKYVDIALGKAPDATAAMSVTPKSNKGKCINTTFYDPNPEGFTVKDILGFDITGRDYGRKFKITLSVYDTEYGDGCVKNKDLLVNCAHTGDLELPIYIKDITVTETVTDINADCFVLAAKKSKA